jgi:large subunit ribosomal protein L21
MFAIIETGGKQYRVSKGSVLEVDRIDSPTGDKIQIDKVVLLSGEDRTIVGKPYVGGSSVAATVIDQGREKKIRVFKFKQRKRYRKTIGHRQYYSKIMIDEIVVPTN